MKEPCPYPGKEAVDSAEIVSNAGNGMWSQTFYKINGVLYECFRSFTGVSWYKYI